MLYIFMSNIIDTFFTFTFLILFSIPFIISLYNRTKIQQKYIDNRVHTKGVLISSRNRKNSLTSLFVGSTIEEIEFEAEVNGHKRVVKNRPCYSDLTWRDDRLSGQTVDVYYLPDDPGKFVSPGLTETFRYWTSDQVIQVILVITFLVTQVALDYYIMQG